MVTRRLKKTETRLAVEIFRRVCANHPAVVFLQIVASLLLVASCGCASLRHSTPDSYEKRQNDKAEAIRAFEAKRDRAQFEAAQSSWKLNDLVGCQDALAKLLLRNPDHLGAQQLQIELALANQDLGGARRLSEGLLDKHADLPAALHLRGMVYEAEGDIPQAVTYYRQAIDKEPRNEAYRLSLKLVTESGPHDKESAAKSAASQSDTQTVKLASSDELETPTEAAVAENALREKSLQEFSTALASGDLAACRRVWRQLHAAYPDDPQIPVSVGIMALRASQSDLALEILIAAREEYSDSAAVQRTLGTALYEAADYPAAKVALEAALSLDNTHPLSYFLLGCTLKKLGQSEAAEAEFAAARRLDPQLPAVAP